MSSTSGLYSRMAELLKKARNDKVEDIEFGPQSRNQTRKAWDGGFSIDVYIAEMMMRQKARIN